MRRAPSLVQRVKPVPGLVLVMSVAVLAIILLLQARGDASRRAQADLGQVSASVTTRTFTPVGVMFGATPLLVRVQMAQLRAQIDGTVERLSATSPVPALAEVERGLDRLYVSQDALVPLIGQMRTLRGRSKMLRDTDMLDRFLGEAESSAAALTRALARARDQYAARATSARTQTTLGSVAAIALLLLAFVIAYWRSLQARADAERLAAENARLAEISRRDALTDALTDLGNRRALIEALDAALVDAESRPVMLALFDLNGFKQYNDTFGHQAGDALLRRLGERLVAHLDGRATAYRMGGDEFCVLARATGDEAMAVARLGAEALSERGDGFEISSSFGIALAPFEATSQEAMLRIADQRMYADKAVGPRASATRQTADVLQQVLIERDDRLAGHGDGVARLAVATGRRLGMNDYELRQLDLAAQLHDIGKSAIPDAILQKPGPLDDEEWEFMRRHTVIGERIVRAAPSMSHVAPLIRSSHERVDGAGYPDGLRREDIPLGARIVAVCDAFDAMITERPYKPGTSVAEALAELRRCAGTQFDERVVAEFCGLVRERSGAAVET